MLQVRLALLESQAQSVRLEQRGRMARQVLPERLEQREQTEQQVRRVPLALPEPLVPVKLSPSVIQSPEIQVNRPK